MVKKYKFKTKEGKTNQAREELKSLEELPLVGGLFKGLEKFIDLAERVEEAGGKIEKRGEIKGLKREVKGVYGFSITMPAGRHGAGIGGRPKIQTFGNIRPSIKKTGKREFKVTKTREPIVDVFDEKDHILIVAELPGMSKEDIKLDFKGDILILEASDGRKKFAKEILLSSKIDTKTKKVSYKNGILELRLNKKV